ncbi:MAG: DUF1638 domain-containing protein [Desulfobulbaceae bacterium]|nr:DUF1638 domain-containing protein [Desulfobulbaceae bacterium]
MAETKLLLTGCGILRKEVELLIAENHWPVETCWLDSALHVNFERLAEKLTGALERYRERETIVFYGTCHPLMDGILKRAGTIRTPGQNCVDILLGQELFSAELARGAFFLLEDWARRWEYITRLTFGTNPALIRELYQSAHTHLLCLRTPCSSDFRCEAEAAGELVGLPLVWRDVSLDHLQGVLAQTIADKLREIT